MRTTVILGTVFWLLCVHFSCSSSKRRIPEWQIRIAQKQGPNTCAVEEIPGTSKKYWTECKYWANREVCGQKTVLRYECCEGFQQVAGKPGCNGVKPMANVLETARNLGASHFVDLLIKTGIADRLKNAGGAHTLFAPTNEAFKSMSPIHHEIFNYSVHDSKTSPLLYHIIDRKVHSKGFGPDIMADTLLGGPGLRINRYSNGMMTVNCVPIIRKDQEATDGVVHLLDQVLLPPASDSFATVPEAIFYDGRFRELSRAILQSNLVNELRTEGPYTLFAPFDEAFQKMTPTELERITENPEVQLALLRNHIISHPVCPTAIIGNHKMKTLGGENLEFFCNESGSYLNPAVKMTGETILTKNGYVVVINDLLIPDQVKTLPDLIRSRDDLSILHQLISVGNLVDILKEVRRPVTLFAPSNEAFQKLPLRQMELLRGSAEDAKSLLKYHLVLGTAKTDSIIDNQRMDNLDKQSSLRLKVYRKAVGVESAIFQERDIMSQDGILHVIDTVLFPPDFSSLELFQRNKNFSLFSGAINLVQETDPGFLNVYDNNSFTIFAPNDQAFQQLGEKKLNSLMDDRRHLKEVLQNHVVDRMISSGSFQSRYIYKVATENEQVKVHKHQGGLMVNDAHFLQHDLVTKDGIVHCIDQVLLPSHKN